MKIAGALALGLAILAVTSAPAPARQAISISLLECGEIFDHMADSAETRGSRPAKDIVAMRKAGERFRYAATAEAKHEGKDDPSAFIAKSRPDLTKKWQGRFAKPTLLSENIEWVKYCGALGKDRGVLPIPKD